MSNKRKATENTDDLVEEVEEITVVVTPEEVVQPPTPVKRARGLTLEQWASMRKVRPQHLGGMRAFLPNSSSQTRTAESWDKVFATY